MASQVSRSRACSTTRTFTPGPGSRRISCATGTPDLDLEHLVEEVDDLGGALKRSVRSRIGTIIEHLLKLEHSRRSTRAAAGTTHQLRSDLVDELTPSIRREIRSARKSRPAGHGRGTHHQDAGPGLACACG